MPVKKRLIICILAALLIVEMPLSAIGDTVTTKVLLDNCGEIRPVSQTRYLMIQSAAGDLWGLFDTDGQQLTDYVLHSPAYVANGCFSDVLPGENGVNSKALVVPHAGVISEYQYGVIRVYNRNWAAGWILSAATEEEHDYAVGKTDFYNIEWCDIFNLAGTPRQVASLTRNAFAAAAAHEDYLSIIDREGRVTVYDGDFELTAVKASAVTDPVYGAVDYALIDKAMGRVIMDGCSAAKELPTAEGMYILVVRVDFKGVKWYGICGLDGEMLLDLNTDLSVKSVTDDYALLARGDRMGLYSLKERRWIVPCEYDSILTSKQTVDPYIFYGYACGVLGNTRDYYDVTTGVIVSSVEVDAASMKFIGGTCYTRPSRVTYQWSPVMGKTWSVRDMRLMTTRGDGRLIIMRNLNDSSFLVYTMDGVSVFSYTILRQPVVTDDGKLILNYVKTGYRLVEVVMD